MFYYLQLSQSVLDMTALILELHRRWKSACEFVPVFGGIHRCTMQIAVRPPLVGLFLLFFLLVLEHDISKV